MKTKRGCERKMKAQTHDNNRHHYLIHPSIYSFIHSFIHRSTLSYLFIAFFLRVRVPWRVTATR